MATPATAFVIPKPMDPEDIEFFGIDLTQGADDDDLLLPGENVASYTLGLTADAVSAGVMIKTGDGYATTMTGLDLIFWLTVADAYVSSATFDGAGIGAALELLITTDAIPPRRKKKTIVVKVVRQ